MYRYANQENTAVLRQSDSAIIPCDAANSDYALLIAQGDPIAAYRRFSGKEEAIAALGAAKALVEIEAVGLHRDDVA